MKISIKPIFHGKLSSIILSDDLKSETDWPRKLPEQVPPLA